jgi:cellulose 1,4-beta-cellobiosidase
MPLYAARANLFCYKLQTLDVNVVNDFNVRGEKYRIYNNVWGLTPGTQCITAYPNSTYFSVTTSTHDSGSVQAYPFILRGRHWGGANTTGSGLPILVSSVATAPFIWSVDVNGATGKWNIAYESFFSITGGTEPNAAEIMIWLNSNGGMSPGGSKVATAVPIGGFNWDVYHASPWSTWLHYIAYKITTPIDNNYVSLDFKDFIDDSVSRGWINTSWYLDNMEAGFELMVSGQNLTSKSFSGLVNKVFSVNFVGFANFASQWGRTDCDGSNGWCKGADYPPEDGKADPNDLGEFVNYWLAE